MNCDRKPVDKEVEVGEDQEVRSTSRGSVTASFGTTARQSHDASPFYSRFVTPTISLDDNIVAPADRPAQDEVRRGTAEELLEGNDFVADNSVALVVTSPPYFVGKDYETDIAAGHIPEGYDQHLANMSRVFKLCVDKLEPGGRIAVNVANLGRKPYRSQAADIIAIFEELKLLLRGEIIWRKGEGMNSSTAWGSFQRPSNPVLRDLTERVIIASKGRFDRALSQRVRREQELPFEGSLFKDEFMAATKDVWDIAAESARRIGHPAPYPVALPQRLIELYTYRNDLILDPYMGSGTTAVAALRSGRNFVGCDAEAQYVDLAKSRIEQELADTAKQQTPTVRVLPRAAKADLRSDSRVLDISKQTFGDFAQIIELAEAGNKLDDIARALIELSGFDIVSEKKKLPSGNTISVVAEGRDGSLWYFDVVGSFSADSNGMNKADVVLRTIGKAALHYAGQVDEAGQKIPYVVLTDTVADKAPVSKSIAAACDAGIFFGIAEVLDPKTLELLRGYANEGS